MLKETFYSDQPGGPLHTIYLKLTQLGVVLDYLKNNVEIENGERSTLLFGASLNLQESTYLLNTEVEKSNA